MEGKWRFSFREGANAREMTGARMRNQRIEMVLRYVTDVGGKQDAFELAHTAHKFHKVPIPTSTIQPNVPRIPTAPRR